MSGHVVSHGQTLSMLRCISEAVFQKAYVYLLHMEWPSSRTPGAFWDSPTGASHRFGRTPFPTTVPLISQDLTVRCCHFLFFPHWFVFRFLVPRHCIWKIVGRNNLDPKSLSSTVERIKCSTSSLLGVQAQWGPLTFRDKDHSRLSCKDLSASPLPLHRQGSPRSPSVYAGGCRTLRLICVHISVWLLKVPASTSICQMSDCMNDWLMDAQVPILIMATVTISDQEDNQFKMCLCGYLCMYVHIQSWQHSQYGS